MTPSRVGSVRFFKGTRHRITPFVLLRFLGQGGTPTAYWGDFAGRMSDNGWFLSFERISNFYPESVGNLLALPQLLDYGLA